MVAQFVLGVGLAAVVALGPVNNRGDGPAGDALQEGVRLLEEDDRVGIAEHDLQADAKRHVDATAALVRAVATRPDDPTARAWYALALLKTFEKDDALRRADEAVRLGPQAAFAYRVRGLVHAGREEHEKAAADLNQAVRLGPRDAANLRARGQFFADRHESERALADYAAALKVDGRDAKAYWLRATLKKMGRREKAADDMSEAIRREPGNTTFRTVRGDLLLELGREEAALADYDEAVRLDPDKAEPHFFRGVGRLIAGHRGSGDDFRAVLRLKGWRHEVSPNCVLDGYAADLLAGRPAEARAFLEQALAKCDAAAWPYPLLRCLHGDVVEADALAAAPGDRERTEARLCLGIKRLSEGRRDAGLRDLREVCDGGDSSGFTIDIARAVLRREGGSPPAAPR